MHEYYVYIMAGKSRTIYTGMTNNLQRRVSEHQTGRGSMFTSKYRVNQLVYYETTSSVHVAIAREKEIKAWQREKKVALIEGMNPTWRDLSSDW